MTNSKLRNFFALTVFICLVQSMEASPPTSPFYKRIMNGLLADLPRLLDKAELSEPPELHFSAVPESSEVAEGADLTLKCESPGIPPPTISWTLNGKPLQQGRYESDANTVEKLLNLGLTTVENGITTSKLRLDCIQPQQAGVYACKASNGYSNIVAEANVNVQAGNAVSKCNLSKKGRGKGSAPLIYMWTDGRFEREGANVQLFCRARGDPEPKIYWVNEEGKRLKSDGPYHQLPNGDLLIQDVDWSVGGGYSCVAANKYGEDRSETFFYPTALEDEDYEESE